MHFANGTGDCTLTGMHITTTTTSPAAHHAAADAPEHPPIASGSALVLGSAMGNQVGAALGAMAFPLIGPAGVVALRQLVAATVLIPAARPRVHRLTWAQWWPAILLGVVMSTMNLALYASIERIGLGLAVTLEFLGPLVVALSGSRTRREVGIAAAAAIGVYVLVLPNPSTDVLGVGLALLAAGCWAAYILLNRTVGQRMNGLEGSALATATATLIYLPVLVVLGRNGQLSGRALALGLSAGVLASVIPYAVDMTVLRRLPTQLFGVLMSMHPLLAAVAGAVLLGQLLAPHEMVGMVLVVAANIAAVLATRGPGRLSAATRRGRPRRRRSRAG